MLSKPIFNRAHLRSPMLASAARSAAASASASAVSVAADRAANAAWNASSASASPIGRHIRLHSLSPRSRSSLANTTWLQRRSCLRVSYGCAAERLPRAHRAPPQHRQRVTRGPTTDGNMAVVAAAPPPTAAAAPNVCIGAAAWLGALARPRQFAGTGSESHTGSGGSASAKRETSSAAAAAAFSACSCSSNGPFSGARLRPFASASAHTCGAARTCNDSLNSAEVVPGAEVAAAYFDQRFTKNGVTKQHGRSDAATASCLSPET